MDICQVANVNNMIAQQFELNPKMPI